MSVSPITILVSVLVNTTVGMFDRLTRLPTMPCIPMQKASSRMMASALRLPLRCWLENQKTTAPASSRVSTPSSSRNAACCVRPRATMVPAELPNTKPHKAMAEPIAEAKENRLI